MHALLPPLARFSCASGHQLACDKAGILHRDISVGNILIVDKPGPSQFTGFIHDFDYSSMEKDIPSVDKPRDYRDDEDDDDDDELDGDMKWDYVVWSAREANPVAQQAEKERTVSVHEPSKDV